MPARLVGRGDVAVAQVAARRDAVGKARVDAGRGSLRFGLGVWVRVRVGGGVGGWGWGWGLGPVPALRTSLG